MFSPPWGYSVILSQLLDDWTLDSKLKAGKLELTRVNGRDQYTHS